MCGRKNLTRGSYQKPNEVLPKPREIVWPSRSALPLALFLGTPPDQALLIGRRLARAHDDAQRTNAQEQLEPNTLAQCTHRRPPIPSRASGRMHAWPQQLASAGTGTEIKKMAAAVGIFNRNSVN